LTLTQTLCWAALVHIFRHEPSAAADHAGRALRICEEHRIAHFRAYALCADGWAQEAATLLAPILGWFTEGFDTADLQSARTLLADLTEPAIAAEG
jgi:hypothetical protein